jgi:hypothetical protein
VSDLDRAIAGKKLILGPYEPVPGFRVAAIEDGGIAIGLIIGLIETQLSDEELWSQADKQSALYSDDPSMRSAAIVAANGRGTAS